MATLIISRRENAIGTPHVGVSEPTVITIEDEKGKLIFGPENARAWGQLSYHLKSYRDVDLSKYEPDFFDTGVCRIKTDDDIVSFLGPVFSRVGHRLMSQPLPLPIAVTYRYRCQLWKINFPKASYRLLQQHWPTLRKG